jgi:probable rRNA maturation factor
MNKSNVNISVEVGSEWEKATGFIGWIESLSGMLNCTIQKKYHDESISAEVDLHLIDNSEMQALNSKFMHKNIATNVLSFPQFGISEIDLVLREGGYIIGDIFLAYGKIEQESREFKIPFFDRCTHLFIHGILHLVGMDHVLQPDGNKMETLEVCILEAFGIKNPYVLWGN